MPGQSSTNPAKKYWQRKVDEIKLKIAQINDQWLQ
jgi:hypothetical protein